MGEPSTVKIFLVEGEPDSVRTAEISNWTGKAVAGPRSRLDLILKRDEASNPGIYFLVGVSPESGHPRVYVGQAENIRTRIKGHLSRDFWTTVVFFVSKDGNLTKAHVQYLEGQLIEMARRADRFELENAQASGSHLPESDKADMNVFLGKVELLLSALGLSFLKPVAEKVVGTQQPKLLSCTIKKLRATGLRTEEGFLVLKGSEAVLEDRPSTDKYPWPATLRGQLVNSGVLVQQWEHLVFTKDHSFSSPSAAAAVIHGGHANGLTAWKDAKGTTLKDLEQLEVETASS